MVQLNGKLLYGHTVNPIEGGVVNGCRQEVEKIKRIEAEAAPTKAADRLLILIWLVIYRF
jgi:hypothetical protein